MGKYEQLIGCLQKYGIGYGSLVSLDLLKGSVGNCWGTAPPKRGGLGGSGVKRGFCSL